MPVWPVLILRFRHTELMPVNKWIFYQIPIIQCDEG